MKARIEGTTAAYQLARIRWRCRRGLKELDVLLERFVHDGLEFLSQEDVRALDRLLDRADPEVLEWLGARTPPEDEELARAVDTIRRHLGLESE